MKNNREFVEKLVSVMDAVSAVNISYSFGNVEKVKINSEILEKRKRSLEEFLQT